MPTAMGHIMIGIGAGAGAVSSERPLATNVTTVLTLCVVSVLPDLDVIAFGLGIPYHHPMGHRGFFHSASFAVVCAVVFWWMCRHGSRLRSQSPLAASELLVFTLAAVSHPLLDMLTDGGLGIAVLSPFSLDRHFFPVQPIPVAPIGISPRLLPVFMWELEVFAPFALTAWCLRWIVNRQGRAAGG